MFVELHIIQNFAPSCLNRDDTNAPKDCEFGGFRRARISSQCIKRSIRTYCAEHAAALKLEHSLAVRSRLLADRLVELLEKDGIAPEKSRPLVETAIGSVLKMDQGKTNVLLFLGMDEIARLKNALLACWSDLADVAGVKSEDVKKEPKARKTKKDEKPEVPESIVRAFDVLKEGTKAVDVALFGRMVAELPNLNLGVDAATQVAHAISTNQVDMEMDFYTAVDDLQPKSETGAGMMGIVEFNSSCFYRYSVLDTRQLERNLGGDAALMKSAVLGYAKAAIYAIPTGKQNSMAAQNLPVHVQLLIRDGQPRSFANAFLAPVRPDGIEDLAQKSVNKMEEHEKKLVGMFGDGDVKLRFRASLYGGDGSIDELLNKLGGAL